MKENLEELSAERCLCKALSSRTPQSEKASSAAFGESPNALETRLRAKASPILLSASALTQPYFRPAHKSEHPRLH
jgi:hypothetical protein